MISSAFRLNMLGEFVTYTSSTDSSTPESASLMTSAIGPFVRILAGRGFSAATAFTGASEMSTAGMPSISGFSALAADEFVASAVKTTALVWVALVWGALAACWRHPPASGSTLTKRARLHLQ
jgi:hypothetical protein